MISKQKEISKVYDKAGWLLVWSYPIEDDHRNCFWHGGEYASAKKNINGHEWLAVFGAYGDVNGTLFDEDGKELDYFRDKCNGADRHNVDDYISDDKELEDARNNGRLVLEDNNWDEMLLYRDGKAVDGSFGMVGDADDVLEDMLSPEELESYIAENFCMEDK